MTTPLPGLDELCEALRGVEGVQGVTLGRQAVEKKVVSQDLEVWMTKQEVADGVHLVARSGRLVQEVLVRTTLSRDAVKAVVQRATNAMK